MKQKDNIVPPSKKGQSSREVDAAMSEQYEQYLDKASKSLSVDRKKLSAAFNNDRNKLIVTFDDFTLAKGAVRDCMRLGLCLTPAGLLGLFLSGDNATLSAISVAFAVFGVAASAFSSLPYIDQRLKAGTIKDAVTEHQKCLPQPS